MCIISEKNIKQVDGYARENLRGQKKLCDITKIYQGVAARR